MGKNAEVKTMATIGELTNLQELLPAHDPRTMCRGEVYYVDLEGVEYASRYIQRKTRPALIIQNNIGNQRAETVIVAPMTRQFKKPYPFQYKVDLNGTQSVILFEQLLTVDKFRILDYVGELNETQMYAAEQALMHSLGLNRLSLDNILGFDVDSKLTKETKAGSFVHFTFYFDLQYGTPAKMQVPLDALHLFDPAIHAGSSLEQVRRSLDNCQGLHWIVTHKEYITL